MHIVQAKVRRGLDAKRNLFDRAGTIVRAGPLDRNLRRAGFFSRDEVVLREPDLLPAVGRRHVVRTVFLHAERAVVEIAWAAGQVQRLAVVEHQHAVTQRAIHGHGQLGFSTFERTQVAAMLLRNRRQAGPARVVVGHLQILDRRQINHPNGVVLRLDRTCLNKVLDIFRQRGQGKAEALPIGLRLHGDRLPGSGRADACMQRDAASVQPNQLCGDLLIAMPAHRGITRSDVDVIQRGHTLLRPGPKQRRTVT